ncbi:degenerin mec-10 [Caerostris extrusa]|uniref:Degenerin mec-10 n=1 Tax=Caerostris extrusa TaxID=172846 RepID=A0AAV4MYL8_CAEEX|nr:degenerin mec-10 [Caerostris extrusa]
MGLLEALQSVPFHCLKDEVSIHVKHSLEGSKANFQYGNCFTLKAKESHILKQWKASSAGYAGGLELVIEVEPEEYVSISHTIGARILIHNPNDTPDPETNGINIIPGYETDISLRQTIIKRLPAPYKDECVSYASHPSKQSQTHCMQDCIQEYNYKQCGCVEISLSAKIDMKKCNVSNSTEYVA